MPFCALFTSVKVDSPLEQVLRRAMARAGLAAHYEHVCRRCSHDGRSHMEKHDDAELRRCNACGMKMWPRDPRHLRFHDLRHHADIRLMPSVRDISAVVSASLIQLLVTSMKLNALNEQLGTMRKTYSETKKLVGYAEEAVVAFRGLAKTDLSGTVQLLEDAVPPMPLGTAPRCIGETERWSRDWKAHEEYCFTAAKDGLMAQLDDSVMQRCQAAEVLGQPRSAREMQILRGEVRQLKDIEAYRLLSENAERKQETDAHSREHQEVLDGAREMAGPEIRVTAPGFDVVGNK